MRPTAALWALLWGLPLVEGLCPNGCTTTGAAESTVITDANFMQRLDQAAQADANNLNSVACGGTTWCSINTWDVSRITTMANAFKPEGSTSHPRTTVTPYFEAFTASLNDWNVSRVTIFIGAFRGAAAFNGEISSWNTQAASSFGSMFQDASNFNIEVGFWNTASATDFRSMFKNAVTFNQPLGTWNMRHALSVDISQMFFNAAQFNQDLSTWDTQDFHNMAYAFAQAASFNQNITEWNTAKVTTMTGTFLEAVSFNQDIGGWDVSKVSNMDFAFAGAENFDQNLGAWNVGSVTSLVNIFSRAAKFSTGYELLEWGHRFPWDPGVNRTGVAITTGGSTDVNGNNCTYYENLDGRRKCGQFDHDPTGVNFFEAKKKCFACKGMQGTLSEFEVAHLDADVRAILRDSNPAQSYTFSLEFFHGTRVLKNGELPCWARSGNFDRLAFDRSYNLCANDTTSTTTTTTVRTNCAPGNFTNAQNQCEACPSGTFKTAVAQQDDPFSNCTAHSACPHPEVVILAGTATHDTVCGAPFGTHCADSQYVAGNATESVNHTWIFECAAFDACPWDSALANTTHAINPVADPQALSEIINRINNAASGNHQEASGQRWVMVCIAKTVCRADQNEFVVDQGSRTADRTCAPCPVICEGTDFTQPAACPQLANTTPSVLVTNECTEPPADNAYRTCCRIPFNRNSFVQPIAPDGPNCVTGTMGALRPKNPQAECSVTMRATQTTSTTTTVTATTTTLTALTSTITSVTTSTTITAPVNIVDLSFPVKGGQRAKKENPKLRTAVVVLGSVIGLVIAVGLIALVIHYRRKQQSPGKARMEALSLLVQRNRY